MDPFSKMESRIFGPPGCGVQPSFGFFTILWALGAFGAHFWCDVALSNKN